MKHPFLAAFAFAIALPLAVYGAPPNLDKVDRVDSKVAKRTVTEKTADRSSPVDAADSDSFDLSVANLKALVAKPEADSDIAALKKSVIDNWNVKLKQIKENNGLEETRDKGKRMSHLQKELNRYKIREKFEVDGSFLNEALDANAYYQIIVEPNFRDGEQVRRDVYVFGLGTNAKFSVGTEVRVTFSRVFKGPNAKSKAIFTIPYWLDRIPTKTSEFQKDLSNGDSVRIEFFGRAGYHFGESAEDGQWKSNVGVSYGGSALFMFDAYKHSDSLIRIRALGMRDLGKFGASAGVKLDPGFRLLGGWLKRLFTFKLGIEAQKSMSKDDFPVDTMMADYLFNLEAPADGQIDATAALDGLLTRIKRFGFSKLFNPRLKDDDVAGDLMAQASLAERIALDDLSRSPNDRRVRHLFKGRMASAVGAFKLGGQASDLLKAYTKAGGIQSHVKSFSEDGTVSYFLLENAFNRTEFRAILGRNEDNRTTDFDLILKSDRDANAGDMLDLIVRSQADEKSMSESEISVMRQKALDSLPAGLSNTDAISAFFPTSDQTNANLTYQVSFGPKALSALSAMDKGTFIVNLQHFIENHPERRLMNLPSDTNPEQQIFFGHYIAELGSDVAKAFDSTRTNQERLESFRQLKNNPLFVEWILGQFFARSLKSEKPTELFKLEVQASSDDIPLKRLEIGDHKTSDIYRSVSFLRSVINDRSFDMHLETVKDMNGNDVIVAPTLRPFSQQ